MLVKGRRHVCTGPEVAYDLWPLSNEVMALTERSVQELRMMTIDREHCRSKSC